MCCEIQLSAAQLGFYRTALALRLGLRLGLRLWLTRNNAAGAQFVRCNKIKFKFETATATAATTDRLKEAVAFSFLPTRSALILWLRVKCTCVCVAVCIGVRAIQLSSLASIVIHRHSLCRAYTQPSHALLSPHNIYCIFCYIFLLSFCW